MSKDSACCETTEPALSWPSSWAPEVFQPPRGTAPVDWTAIVFGSYDLRSHACDCSFVHNVPIDGVLKDVYPPPPIWRTLGDRYRTYLDIALGRPEPDSPSYLTARNLRDWTPFAERPGVASGVVPLSYLSAISIPGDFTADESLAQSVAAAAFSAGTTLPYRLREGDQTDFWPRILPNAPTATRQLPSKNAPIRLIGTLAENFAVTLTRPSLPMLAAARSLAVREMPIWLVYV